MQNLAKFNGPRSSDWATWRQPEVAPGAWFILAEVQQHWQTGDHAHLIEELKAVGILCAAIFYDAIPIKMPSLYPTWLSQAHFRYMIELGFYDVVFPISHFVADDLRMFLRARGVKHGSLARLVRATPLAGEFPGIPRATEQTLLAASNPLRILAVGTVEPRKNHETLVRAFLLAKELSLRHIELTIVGNTNILYPGLGDRIRKLIAKHASITWFDSLDDSELAEI